MAMPAQTAADAPGGPMLDIIYILVTVAFFALMLAYVRACARIGLGAGSPTPTAHTRREDSR